MIEEAIRIKIEPKDIKLSITEPIYISLKMTRALNNDYMVFDHPLYDVVVSPSKNKISTFSKQGIHQSSYPSQDKMFSHLANKGLIDRSSVQSGNIHNSLEAQYPINNDVKTVQAILYCLYNFFKEEIALFKSAQEFIDMTEEDYYDPSDEDSTELGEVPHEPRKGSIEPGYRPYGMTYRL